LVSTFPSLDAAQKDIIPVKELWGISYQYAEKRQSWWQGKINTINAEHLQENVASYSKTLNQLKKMADTEDFKGPSDLRAFIYDELQVIKQYLPIIISLRANGLEKKHFEEMSRILGINIDPS
jgi:dynein heavy chain